MAETTQTPKKIGTQPEVPDDHDFGNTNFKRTTRTYPKYPTESATYIRKPTFARSRVQAIMRSKMVVWTATYGRYNPAPIQTIIICGEIDAYVRSPMAKRVMTNPMADTSNAD